MFLADLTHTGMQTATDSFPLNIGLIASYALKKFGSDIRIRLFKYPDESFHALQREQYDCLACSTYVWNNNLAEWACAVAKMFNPSAITVRGGWNFPLEETQQKKYLVKHKFTDIFCMFEGEIAFSNIIERLLGIENKKQWEVSPINGCAFLKSESGTFIKGHTLSPIDNLDKIPSPYTLGLLDPFFDGNLTPIIETTRGCPFKCNYCNNSNDYYNKVRMFSAEYITEDINYIARKITNTGISNLTIADTNFGMYPRDKKIAHAIKNVQEQYGWPIGISASTGKNKVGQILDIVGMLGNALTVSMSVQSMNPTTLKSIKRDNIRLETYEEVSKSLIKEMKSPMAEVIVPLPCETITSYMAGIEQLVNMGAKKIVSYTLQLNNGTIYKNEEYRKQFGYQGKFRLIPNDFGTYGDQKIFDYEEVAVYNNSLSFEDYLAIRKFALVTELVFNNSIFLELFKFLNENRVSDYTFIKCVLDKLDNAPKSVREVFDSFILATKGELHDSEEALIDYYTHENNYEKVKRGELGGNLIFGHKGLMLSKYMIEWIDHVFACVFDILGVESEDGKSNEVSAIKSFIIAKLDGLFAPERTQKDIIINPNMIYCLG